MSSKPEVWQRGPVAQTHALLQPVAHALLQAREELEELVPEISESVLWKRPAGVASPAFHLQHLSGVLDRVFTYARAETLTAFQFTQLRDEDLSEIPGQSAALLFERFDAQVEKALAQLKATDISTLTDYRGVGRQQLPSTVIGLLVHAAEHTMRHLGQLRVTVKLLNALGDQAI